MEKDTTADTANGELPITNGELVHPVNNRGR